MKNVLDFETLKEPFTGWKFLAYLGLAFLPWVIIKEILREQDIILGGVFSTLLLFAIVGAIGLFFGSLNRNLHKLWSENELPHIRSFFKNDRRAVFLAIIIIAILGGWWMAYRSERRTAELACLQEIEYRVSSYRILEGGNIRHFKTQNEAMNYCLKVLRPWE